MLCGLASLGTAQAAPYVEAGKLGDPASWRSAEYQRDWGLGRMQADQAYAAGISGAGVKIGALDMTRVNISPMNSICGKTNIPVLPFLFRSVDHLHKVLDGPVGEEIAKDCEAQGFIVLAYYDSGSRSIYSKKPVKSVADTKGMKIRVQQSDLWVGLATAMGAN
eukprot:gene3704-4751_t